MTEEQAKALIGQQIRCTCRLFGVFPEGSRFRLKALEDENFTVVNEPPQPGIPDSEQSLPLAVLASFCSEEEWRQALKRALTSAARLGPSGNTQ
jgi:hypothetical protein